VTVWFDPFRGNRVDPPQMTGEEDLKGFSEWDFCYGKLVAGWDDSAWLKAPDPSYDGNPSDVLFNHLDIPIFSARLRRALDEEWVTGLQYLPIRVFRSDGTEIPGYSIANVLNLIPAVDHERSEYVLWGEDRPDRAGEIHYFKKLVVRESALFGLNVVRLAEYKLYLLVSEKFKNVFDSRGFTGYSFHEVETS
jgi:hypothetical protein